MEIEKILFEIFKRRSLRHVVGKLIEIPEPHFSISPVSESGRCHLSQSSHSFGPVNSQDLSLRGIVDPHSYIMGLRFKRQGIREMLEVLHPNSWSFVLPHSR